MIRRGEIYWVAFEPIKGSEADKTRPALVVSNDRNNEHANTVTVLAISTKIQHIYPFEVHLRKGQGGIPENSKVMAHHIRTVDKHRLQGLPLGTCVDQTVMENVKEAIKLHLDIS